MKKVKILNDNLMIGVIPSSNQDSGAFLASQEDTTFVGVVLAGGAVTSRAPFGVGDKVYFGKDYLQMNVEGVMVKIMPCSNVKACVLNSSGEVKDG